MLSRCFCTPLDTTAACLLMMYKQYESSAAGRLDLDNATIRRSGARPCKCALLWNSGYVGLTASCPARMHFTSSGTPEKAHVWAFSGVWDAPFRHEISSGAPPRCHRPLLVCKPEPSAVQEAAGAFSHLQSRVVPQLATPRPEDLSQECTGMLAALCMAQVRHSELELLTGYRVSHGAYAVASPASTGSLSSPRPHLLEAESRERDFKVSLDAHRRRSASTSKQQRTRRHPRCWPGPLTLHQPNPSR